MGTHSPGGGPETYRAERLSDRVVRIRSSMGVYMDLILGDQKALLVDTGYGLGDLENFVRQITALPLVIVNTHGHVDHACGNWQFEEPVYIHPYDMALCREHCDKYHRALALTLGQDLQAHAPGNPSGSVPFPAQSYLSQGTGTLLPAEGGRVFDLGNVHLRVVWLPGHTPGSIGLWYEEEDLFFAGDAFNASTWLFLPEAESLDVYRKTLKKAIALAPGKLLFSHEPGPVSPEVLRDYLDLTEHLDYESGTPFSAPLVPGAAARVCYRRGYGQGDENKSGFASIVINRDHLQ